jgi:hypothetical protein
MLSGLAAGQMDDPSFGFGRDDRRLGRMRQIFQGRLEAHGQSPINALVNRISTCSHRLGDLADRLASLITEQNFSTHDLARGSRSRLRNRLKRFQLGNRDQQNRTLGFSSHPAIETLYPHYVDTLMKRCTSEQTARQFSFWSWCNKVVRSATAELGNHPGFRVHREYEREVKRGNPDYWTFGFSYKNYSNLRCHTGKRFKEQYRDEKRLRTLKLSNTPEKFHAEGLGLWQK